MTKTASATITVTAAGVNKSELKGQYAFLFKGFDEASGMHVAVVGSLTADGMGNITGGEEDINGLSGAAICGPAPGCPLNVTSISGTYSINADNRGTISITNPVRTTKCAIAVGSLNASGVATKARFIEFDDITGTTGTRGSGVMFQQQSTPFTRSEMTGPYALGESGQDAAGGRIAVAGRFDADGMGNFMNGILDVNDNGMVPPPPIAFTGTYGMPDTNGRVTASETSAGGTAHFVFYIVNANQALLMTTDPEASAGLATATVLSQTSTKFTQSSLSGNAVFSVTGVGSVSGSKVTVGVATADGAGNFTSIFEDVNDGGMITPNRLTMGVSYTVSPNGRVVTTSASPHNPILYLVDTNEGFFLNTDMNVDFGSFEPQGTGQFSQMSISGSYFFGVSAPVVAASAVSSGVATSDGVMTITETADSSASNGTLTSGATQSVTYNVQSANDGRTTVDGAGVAYIISLTRFVLIDESMSDTTPVIIFVEHQ